MHEKITPEQNPINPEERKRRVRILVSLYFQMEDGMSEEEAHKKVDTMSEDELEEHAKKGQKTVRDLFNLPQEED